MNEHSSDLKNFHQAILSGNIKELKKIKFNNVPEYFKFYNPFVDASIMGNVDVLKILYDNLPDLISCEDNRNFTPFQQALLNGHLEAAKFIFKCQRHPENNSLKMGYILHEVILKNQLGILKFLLNFVDINWENQDGLSSLHQAVTTNNDSIIKLLISKQALINSTDKKGDTPLHLAIKLGNNSAARTLIPLIPCQYIDQVNCDGDSALHVAVYKQNIDIIPFLLKIGADINLENKKKLSPINIANHTNNSSLKKLFKNHNKSNWSKFVKIFKKFRMNKQDKSKETDGENNSNNSFCEASKKEKEVHQNRYKRHKTHI